MDMPNGKARQCLAWMRDSEIIHVALALDITERQLPPQRFSTQLRPDA